MRNRRRFDRIHQKEYEGAEEHMKKTNIPCWIETHRRMKWRMAMRIAFHPQERWTSKRIARNPGLDNKIKRNRSVGRPRRRWEDDINEQLRPEETEESNGNDLKNKSTWMIHAKRSKKNGRQRKNSLERKTAAKLEADEANQKATRFLL